MHVRRSLTGNGAWVVGRKAVFLDRDGTLNVEKGFVYRIEDFEFVDGAAELIGNLNLNGYLVVIVTNQSGVARGLYTENDVRRLHKYVNNELQHKGAHVDRFYYCPHHPEASDPAYRKDCTCRKPEPGMVLQAMEELHIDPRYSYMIGDRARDICAGKKAGLTSILIRDDNAIGTAQSQCDEDPDLIVKSLHEAVQYILDED